MGIYRPTNLNIRDVPGNGSIVGPSTSATLGVTTTTCESCFNISAACAVSFDGTVLGATNTFCAESCYDDVCVCDCTVCDRTVPSGMWKTSEQYAARESDTWGDDTCSSGPETCICNINYAVCGATKSACNVPVGGTIICVSGRVGWVVAPVGTEVTRNWHNRADAVTTAEASAACGDWFVPTCGQLLDPGCTCNTYWSTTDVYWSDTDNWGPYAFAVKPSDGAIISTLTAGAKNQGYKVRAFRCVSY